jgi:hypothetical protein
MSQCKVLSWALNKIAELSTCSTNRPGSRTEQAASGPDLEVGICFLPTQVTHANAFIERHGVCSNARCVQGQRDKAVDERTEAAPLRECDPLEDGTALSL